MEFEEVIKTRRSIRFYADTDVEDELITKILKAGMQAPGSRLKAEPWEFIVVKDARTREKLGNVAPNTKKAGEAPVVIVPLANINRAHYKMMWQEDMGACTENMLLEACNLGLGGLWIGVAPVEERMNDIAEIFSLPEGVKPYCMVCIGYPADDVENRFMDKFDESRIYYEKY